MDDTVTSEILNICEKVASPNRIVAASIHGLKMSNYAGEKKDVNVLLIVDSSKLTLKYRHRRLRSLKDVAVSLLVVDQKTFKKDAERDWLGGLLVENMLTPYQPLTNRDFLWDQEVKVKKRIVIEILGNLVLEYPEMSHELLIKPEYFMFECMARKASLYPPITHRFLAILRSDAPEEEREHIMKGFNAALEEAAEEELLTFSDGHVKIVKEYIDTIQRRKLRVLNLLKAVRNSILRHSVEVFPKMMRSLIEDYGLYTKQLLETEYYKDIHLPELEDPKNYLFIPTPLGLVSLSEKVTIEDFVKQTFPDGRNLRVETEKIGGALNAVYMLRLRGTMEEKKIVVKVFKDWYGWKWFPLALWALGTRGFAVLGKSRLAKEYTINRFLSSQGFHVPQIIYVSPKERLIFQEYVEGENLTSILRRICSSKETRTDLFIIVSKVGGEVAKAHKLDVALGDCKPENIIVTDNKGIFFVDLEQAERGGDQAWDIAELLYYSGHYASLSSIEVVQSIAKEFVNGYLEAGGKIGNIKRARSPRYVKVFSFLTPPHILLVISNICKEILKGKSEKDNMETKSLGHALTNPFIRR